MNKKIKVIELLNKIANEEKMPKKIAYKGKIYNYNKEIRWYSSSDCYDCYEWFISGDRLNNEIEILEDNIEEGYELLKSIKTEDNTEEIEELLDYNYSIKENRDKINELVKRINYIERKINEQ